MIRTVQVKDAGQIRDLCHQALGYDSTLEKVAAQIEKFNLPDSGHFCFVYEEDQTGHILGYVEAEVYESLYSDAGLNILGLAVFPSAHELDLIAWFNHSIDHTDLKDYPTIGIIYRVKDQGLKRGFNITRRCWNFLNDLLQNLFNPNTSFGRG